MSLRRPPGQRAEIAPKNLPRMQRPRAESEPSSILQLLRQTLDMGVVSQIGAPKEDSNLRQHDGVGAEIGLQRLSAKTRGNALKSSVSANRPTPKVPTNGHLLAVSPARTKRGGLVGGPHQTRTSDNNDGCNISGACTSAVTRKAALRVVASSSSSASSMWARTSSKGLIDLPPSRLPTAS